MGDVHERERLIGKVYWIPMTADKLEFELMW
jgi:hypothetical protein